MHWHLNFSVIDFDVEFAACLAATRIRHEVRQTQPESCSLVSVLIILVKEISFFLWLILDSQAEHLLF